MREELKDLTTLGIGGDASEIVKVSCAGELITELEKAKREKILFIVVGGGSNTLFMDEGFNGRVIVNNKGNFGWEGNDLVVESGANLGRIISELMRSGKGEFERMVGIPGTVGGALWNNAGAYGQSISDYLLKVEVWTSSSGIHFWDKNEMRFEYRKSRFYDEREGGIAIRAWFRDFKNESPEKLKEIAGEILEKRNEKLPPPNWKTCGSLFRNLNYSSTPPERMHTGKLLEQIGAKKIRCGDAGMFEKHANILINYGRATSRDVLSLIDILSNKVEKEFGAVIKPEIKIVPSNPSTA